jgi:hypothetical protein
MATRPPVEAMTDDEVLATFKTSENPARDLLARTHAAARGPLLGALPWAADNPSESVCPVPPDWHGRARHDEAVDDE